MPLPARLARFNRRVTNPVLGTVAPYLPPMALVVHRGRRSGKPYRTPVLAFPVAGGYAIALTYGPDTDWVHNVMAAQGCTLRRRGRQVRLAGPRILQHDGLNLLPVLLRPALRLMNVTKVLHLTAVK